MITRLDACKLLLDGKEIQYSRDGECWNDFSLGGFMPSNVLFNTDILFYFREKPPYKFICLTLSNVYEFMEKDIHLNIYECFENDTTEYVSTLSGFDLNLLKNNNRKFGWWEEV